MTNRQYQSDPGVVLNVQEYVQKNHGCTGKTDCYCTNTISTVAYTEYIRSLLDISHVQPFY